MSKFSLENAPKPRNIDDFERHGAGHDSFERTEREPRKYISYKAPASLHYQFKLACSKSGVQMSDVLRKSILAYIGEHG